MKALVQTDNGGWYMVADAYCWKCYGIGVNDLGYTENVDCLNWDPVEWVEHYAIKYDLERVENLTWKRIVEC